MRTSAGLGLLVGTAAIAFVTLGLAVPASAATLPDGQTITIIDDLDDAGPQEGQFYTVNPANAAATPVGTGSGVYAYGLDVGDDGLGYAIGNIGDYSLYHADANTGTMSNPQPLHFSAGALPYNCGDIDYNPTTGEVLVPCVQFSNETGNIVYISSVDTTSGLLTPIVTVPQESGIDIDALATDPVTGVLWAFGGTQTTSDSYTVDRTLGTLTHQATMDDYSDAADFDRNGQLFFAAGHSGHPALVVLDPAVGTFTFAEAYLNTVTSETLTEVESLTVWGAAPVPVPVLAATGLDSTPLGISAALALLAGAAALVARRRDRTA